MKPTIAQLTDLARLNPCSQGTPESEQWMWGLYWGAHNATHNAPTDTDVPAYWEGWAEGQRWYRENVARVK